jgi:hypothetical protein
MRLYGHFQRFWVRGRKACAGLRPKRKEMMNTFQEGQQQDTTRRSSSLIEQPCRLMAALATGGASEVFFRVLNIPPEQQSRTGVVAYSGTGGYRSGRAPATTHVIATHSACHRGRRQRSVYEPPVALITGSPCISSQIGVRAERLLPSAVGHSRSSPVSLLSACSIGFTLSHFLASGLLTCLCVENSRIVAGVRDILHNDDL